MSVLHQCWFFVSLSSRCSWHHLNQPVPQSPPAWLSLPCNHHCLQCCPAWQRMLRLFPQDAWGFTRNQARIQDEQRPNSSTSICNHKDQKVWLLTNMHVVWTSLFSWLLLGGKSVVPPIRESMLNEYVMNINSYTSRDDNCILTTLPIVEYILLPS